MIPIRLFWLFTEISEIWRSFAISSELKKLLRSERDPCLCPLRTLLGLYLQQCQEHAHHPDCLYCLVAAYHTTQTLGFSSPPLGTQGWSLNTDDCYLVNTNDSGVDWLLHWRPRMVSKDALPRGGAARAAAVLFSE